MNLRKLVFALGVAFSSIIITVIYLKTNGKRIKRRRIGNFHKLIKLLNNDSVHMKDPKYVETIIRNMIDKSKEKLQVITDFDWTLSKYHSNGNPVDTCFSVFRHSRLLPSFYVDQSARLHDVYYPIEMDLKLTVEEKIPYMVEWWTKAQNLLVQCNITRSTLATIMQEAHIVLRDGCDKFFDNLCRHDIPLLVFSGGIGDVIQEVLRLNNVLYDNIKIVSNYMDFNHHGILTGFTGDIIHVFNKNEKAIPDSDYFDRLSSRESIILLGDSLGDVNMEQGNVSAKDVLKIGFLNDQIQERLPSYIENFDIVLVGDETMSIPNAIIGEIL